MTSLLGARLGRSSSSTGGRLADERNRAFVKATEAVVWSAKSDGRIYINCDHSGLPMHMTKGAVMLLCIGSARPTVGGRRRSAFVSCGRSWKFMADSVSECPRELGCSGRYEKEDRSPDPNTFCACLTCF